MKEGRGKGTTQLVLAGEAWYYLGVGGMYYKSNRFPKTSCDIELMLHLDWHMVQRAPFCFVTFRKNCYKSRNLRPYLAVCLINRFTKKFRTANLYTLTGTTSLLGQDIGNFICFDFQLLVLLTLPLHPHFFCGRRAIFTNISPSTDFSA